MSNKDISRLNKLFLSLEPTNEQMHNLISQAADLVINYLSNMSQQKASNIPTNIDSELSAIRQPITENGIELEEIITLIKDQILKYSVNTAGGTYQAYIPGGGIFAAAVAEFIAAATNRYVGVWGVAPAGVEAEMAVICWLCKIVNYPNKAKGIFTSGGSMANFSAIVTARRAILPENFLSGIIYTSDQVHQSIQKAALMAGFPPQNVRLIASDKEFRLNPDNLLAAIQEDKEKGLTPFLIVGNVGTTNTGAIDPIDKLVEIAHKNNIWLHIDAAYGGFFILTERGKELFSAIEHADSITLDPHKGLFLPYGTGCLLVRDGEFLKRAHQVTASYLQDLDLAEEIINFNDYSPELTRSFRGLRLWLPLKLYGEASFREYLDEKLDLASYVSDQLKQIPNIEIVAEAQLSVVAFRYLPKSGDINQINRELLSRINATQKTFISSTVINGQVILRVAILCFRTHLEAVQATIQAIKIAISQIET